MTEKPCNICGRNDDTVKIRRIVSQDIPYCDKCKQEVVYQLAPGNQNAYPSRLTVDS